MADMADGIAFVVVVVFDGIGLMAVDDALGCCVENALSCEFIESLGDCTGADVGIVKGILRIEFLFSNLLFRTLC